MISSIRSWMVRRQLTFPSRFWGVYVCWFCSLLFLLFQGGRLSFMLFVIITFLSVYLISGQWSGILNIAGVRSLINVDPLTELKAGTPIMVQFELRIPGYWPIPYVLVKDRLIRKNGGELNFEISFVPDWRRRGVVKYQTRPLSRGLYHFAPTRCSTEDIFGLFRHSSLLSAPYSFSVAPQTVPIRNWHQFHQLYKGHHYHSTSTTRAMRETTQINGVREYIYGDRISRIHWNATARTGNWKSKEFERESLPKTMIMLDRNRDAYRTPEQFELAVSIAASLIQYAIGQDQAVGLLSVGASSIYFEPRRHAEHQKSLTRHMIEVEPDGAYPLLSILKDRARYFAQGCFFVMISPQTDESAMQALHWIYHRQMNPCHILASEGKSSRDEQWMKLLENRGYLGYAVPVLQQLPKVLEGGG